MPPLVLDILHRRLKARSTGPWCGIYPHRRDVPSDGGTYESDEEVGKHLAWTRSALDLAVLGKKPRLWHGSLALLAAAASANTGRVRVVDFGGAVGSGYVQLLSTLPKSTSIKYYVVDLERMCTAGRQLFADDSRIEFHTSLSMLRGGLDIIYVNSALQYVDDYQDLLRRLAGLNAPLILLARLAGGNFPTYATKQINLQGLSLPYWFLNLDELRLLLAAENYRLIYQGEDDQEFDQSNFPKTHRIDRMLNLIFFRNETRK